MIGVVASPPIMMMPLSSPGSDGVQWWHRHKENLLGRFFFFLIHFLCLVSLHLNQAVCVKCCTVMGNNGPWQLPSTCCCCIKLKADNAEITCTSLSTLFQLIHLMGVSQFPVPSKKTPKTWSGARNCVAIAESCAWRGQRETITITKTERMTPGSGSTED